MSEEIEIEVERSEATSGALEEMRNLASEYGGAYEEPESHRGSFGRTLFDSAQSEDGSVTVVMPHEELDAVPGQSLVRIISRPDSDEERREYIGAVIAGPFAEPDGMRADAPGLVISAVNRAIMMPRYHGRAQVALLGEMINGRLVPPRFRPKPNSPTWVVPDNEMTDILGLHGDMRLGLAEGHDNVEIKVPSDKKSVLGRHMGVLGTTGGGKSTTVTTFINECQKAGVAVVLFDTEGEYTTVNQPTDDADMLTALAERGLSEAGIENTHVFHLNGRECSNPQHDSVTPFSLRLANISPWALKEILELNDAQEERLLRAYEMTKELMRELRVFPRDNSPAELAKQQEINEFERGWPRMTLAHLEYVVQTVVSIHESQNQEPSYLSATGFVGNWDAVRRKVFSVYGSIDRNSGERSEDRVSLGAGGGPSWKRLLSRIARIRRLAVFDVEDMALNYQEMLEPGRVNIIDLSDLENTDVRNLAIAEILRGVQMMQDLKYRNCAEHGQTPNMVNIIIEEAHEFLSVHRIKNMPIMREQVERIAKRGRKRYLGLTFVTQLPQHLPDQIMALLNNWVIHKISDGSVINRLKNSVHGLDNSVWKLVPGLAAGQAVVSFTHMKRPLITSIDASPAKLRMVD